uniref:Uncharacterized protein n=1 Tax=Oryza rufipogon TaxID=4529 RepID=A0A0E0PD15_ORYRU
MRADATFRRRPVARAVAQLGTTLPHRPRRPAAPPAPSRIAPPSAARTHPREDKVGGEAEEAAEAVEGDVGDVPHVRGPPDLHPLLFLVLALH